MSKDIKQPTVQEELAKVTSKLALLEKEGPIDPFEPSTRIAKQNLKLEDREKNDIRVALNNPAVRRLFYRIDKMSGRLGSSADPNPIVMAHHEGRRSIGIDIFNAIEDALPGVFYQMSNENISNKQSDQKQNREEPENA